jgi:hypothetical protein
MRGEASEGLLSVENVDHHHLDITVFIVGHET